MNNNLKIFVLSFGRPNIPTLRWISDKRNVTVLTSVDNKCINSVDTQGAELMVFDKSEFKCRGLEMMNEESVPQRRSAVYAYNYAIEWGRKHGFKYVLVLDDDYTYTQSINDRKNHHPFLDKWAMHAVSFLEKYPFIAASCAINCGELYVGARSAYFSNIAKRQLMNTIIFNTNYKHYFHSLGNGDYIDQCMLNTYSRTPIVRLATVTITTETIDKKKHATIDYSNLFYSRWSAKMASPAYVRIEFGTGGSNHSTEFRSRFNTHMIGRNNAPKILC